MTLAPGWRKLTLTLHLVSSLGWLGAVAAFVALSVGGLRAGDAQELREAYPAMAAITWSAIVPFALASLASGVVASVGTQWGLLQHYWVLAKLVLTVAATAILLVHLRPIDVMAHAAIDGSAAALTEIKKQLLVDSIAAIVALLLITVLGVYKPRGLTRYGWRKRHDGEAGADAAAADV